MFLQFLKTLLLQYYQITSIYIIYNSGRILLLEIILMTVFLCWLTFIMLILNHISSKLSLTLVKFLTVLVYSKQKYNFWRWFQRNFWFFSWSVSSEKHTLAKMIQIKGKLNLVDIWRIRTHKTKLFLYFQSTRDCLKMDIFSRLYLRWFSINLYFKH